MGYYLTEEDWNEEWTEQDDIEANEEFLKECQKHTEVDITQFGDNIIENDYQG